MSYGTTEDFAWATEMKTTSPARSLSPSSLAPPDIIVEDSSTESVGTASTVRSRRRSDVIMTEDELDFESNCVHVAENSIEAHRIKNNHKFGMKMWKSHLTNRPLDQRSEIIRELYSDIDKVKDHKVSTVRPSNILYTLLFGWWLFLLYGIMGLLMAMTVVGLPYASFCWRLAVYFLWPFGKFVSQVKRFSYNGPKEFPSVQGSPLMAETSVEGVSLINSAPDASARRYRCANCRGFWSRPASWIWLIIGLPPLIIAHSIVFAVCWFFIVSIPSAKINGKMLSKVLYLNPSEVEIGDFGANYEDGNCNKRRILMYTHQSINVYFYKYSVDGVNIIMVNLLSFVVISIALGFAADISPLAKAILGFLAIVPLTYYIGMAIASISAQSTFAVGAFLNALFGSAVEVILCVLILKKGVDTNDNTYQEVVKAALAGAFFMGILFIPGMSMVIGGLKFRTQRFNPKSTNITASHLFLTVVGVFAPTIFFKIYGSMKCSGCQMIEGEMHNNATASFICHLCQHSLTGYQGENYVYIHHIKPLIYAVSVVLPLSYMIGVVFTLKSHSQLIFEDFERELKDEIGDMGQEEGAQWSRLKCAFILFMCAVATALCGELISDNLQPLLEATGMSEYFVGVSLLALVAGLPECVNGIQFALHNNVNLGIEVGCATAIQVGMVQIPALVFIDLVYNLNFDMVFNDVHLWAVLFSVLIINYIFQDGKSDYFQGAVVVSLHFLLMLMYYFMLTPDELNDKHGGATITTTTTTTPSAPHTP